jgi:hypothetical protein
MVNQRLRAGRCLITCSQGGVSPKVAGRRQEPGLMSLFASLVLIFRLCAPLNSQMKSL